MIEELTDSKVIYRKKTKFINFNKKNVKSGDVILITRFDGID